MDYFGFFLFFLVSFKDTKVTTKCYHGYYWTPKIAKNGPKQHKKLFFCPKDKKSLGQSRSPPQELEVGPRSEPNLLVFLKQAILDRKMQRYSSITLHAQKTQFQRRNGKKNFCKNPNLAPKFFFLSGLVQNKLKLYVWKWISWQISSNWLFQRNVDSDLQRAQTSEHCFSMAFAKNEKWRNFFGLIFI